MRALRLPLPGYDLALRLGAGFFTLFAAYLSVKMGAQIGFGLVLLIAFFALCVLGFLFAPHWTTALMIPTFAFIPAAKVLVTPNIGPLKDLVTLAAILAEPLLLLVAGLTLANPRRTLRYAAVSFVATACVAALSGL